MQITSIENTIVEVTHIGTGGGYGESIVVNLGHNNWIVIDSCIDPYTKKCLPLEYLEAIGVNLADDVKLIICSHWHDDHILGISELLERCENAKLSIAQTTDRKKFLQLVGLDYNKINEEVSASSTIEFAKCLDIIQNRNSSIISALQDKVLYSFNNHEINSEVISLSPSDFVLQEFNEELSVLIDQFGKSNKKIIVESPNTKSVVILLKINEQRIILGSDLEYTEDERKGWKCILNTSQTIDNKSNIFKIPHHGSQNAYHKTIWEKLIAQNAISTLSPWNRNQKLPQNDMLNKFLEHTSELFITSIIFKKPKPKKRDRSINKAIEKFNKSLKEITYHKGIIQCRLNILDSNEKWEVILYDAAQKVDNSLIS